MSRMAELHAARQDQMDDEERRWQETMTNDPGYWEWVKKLEQQRTDDAGRRADEAIKSGTTPF